MGNSIAIDCDMSLKTFLQTLKHSKRSHKCILHEIPPPCPPETWPTMRLRATLASSDISSSPAFLPPTAAPIQSESQRPNTLTASPAVMAKRQATYENSHSFHLQ